MPHSRNTLRPTSERHIGTNTVVKPKDAVVWTLNHYNAIPTDYTHLGWASKAPALLPNTDAGNAGDIVLLNLERVLTSFVNFVGFVLRDTRHELSSWSIYALN